MHRSPLGLATMVNNVSFVARMISLYPLLLAAFTQARSSPPDTSVSLGTYPLSSAMALNLRQKSSFPSYY